MTGSGNTSITWTLTPSGTGSLTPSGSTATYTAPTVTSRVTVTLRAASQADPSKFAEATVTVDPPPVVMISPRTVSLGQGESANFTAAVSGLISGSDQSVTWSTPGPGSVTPAGRFTAPASILANQTVTVQAASNAFPGATDMVSVQLRAPACSLRLSADSASFESSGGSGLVNVETSPGCAWTATSNDAWVVITSGTSGNGPGTVRFDVQAGGAQSRVAVLSIAGLPFTVTQGASACIAGLNPPKLALGHPAGNRTVALTMSAPGCPWTAASQASWIRVTSAAEGTGPASISLSFDGNTSGFSRSGAISIAGLLLTVTQASANCDAITINRAPQSFPAAGGRGSIAVQAPEGCGYSVSSTGTLLTLDPPANRSGESIVNFQVSNNTTNAVRDGVITVAGHKIVVRQSGQASASISCQVLNVADPVSVRSTGHAEQLSPLDLNCSGRTGGRTITADVVVSLNAGLGNRLSGAASDLVDATLTIAGGGTVTGRLAGGNAVRFTVPLSNGEPSISIQMRIDRLRAAPSMLGTTSDAQGVPIIATVQVQSPVDLSITGARQTIGISRAALRTQQGQLRDGPGSGQRLLPVVVEEGFPGAFRNREAEGSGSDTGTRFLLSLSNLPDDIQLFAPVNAFRGFARLLSADGNGAGGSAVTGSSRAGGTYERLTVSGGRAFAVWELTQSDPSATDLLEFLMLIEGGTPTALARVRTQVFFAPFFATSAANPTAPLPRFVAPDRPTSLQDLRIQADVSASSAGGPAIPGGTARFTYVVTNESDQPATDVVLHSTLSDALSNATCSSSRPCATSGRDLRAQIGSLNPGEQATVSLNAAVSGLPNCPNCVSSGVILPSTAGVTAAGNDPAPANNYIEVPLPVDAPCQFNLSRPRVTAPGGGATLQVDVFTGPACEWSQPALDGGVAVAPSGALRGGVAFSLTVPANPTAAERLLNVNLGGQNLEIVQAGRDCSFEMQNQPIVPAAGGSFQMPLVTACEWRALAGPDWLRITSAETGAGNTTITYSAQPNQSIVTRLGWIEAGGRIVTIRQQPVSSADACTFSINRTSGTASAAGDTLGLVVSASASNCTWNAQSDSNWVTFGGTLPRSDTGTLRIMVAANAGAPRSASLTIAGKTFSLHQAGSGCSFGVSPATMSSTAPGGGFTLSISTQPACAFTAVSSQPWITMQGGGTNSGSSTAAYNVSSNGGAARSGSISVAGEFQQIAQSASNPQQQFGDVSLTHGFYNFVTIMRDRGITSGCGNGNYCPDAITTRGQMAVFIIRALMGGDNFAFPTTPYFTDVPANHGFFKWIQKMRELGITTGCTASTYCPDAAVTRGQMAAFIVRARLGLAGGEVFSFPSALSFSDVPGTHPFYTFIQKMRQLAITSGCTANTYCPDSDTTRGQMSVFIVRGLLTP
ncbi:MAG: S-layer homology domain-containing protein [Bryobacterales bacterium]|nr:S-layer homology domain-containing protein [Bryobacterales bacterium]